jgi:hypothetical protein
MSFQKSVSFILVINEILAVRVMDPLLIESGSGISSKIGSESGSGFMVWMTKN